MTWSNITRHGNGRMRFAVIIEGWPEIWVTDHSITLTDGTNGARGRTVRVGLLRKGLQFRERAQLLQGKLDASAMTFRFVSSDHAKHCVSSFATQPTTVGDLIEDLETSDTSITLRTAAAIESTYYHVGTEVIHMTEPEGPSATKAITRAHWDTQAQSFYLLDGEDLLTHQIYTRPRSAEGRRATLYVWGDGDDATGYDPTGASNTLGRPIWRGIITLPPRRDNDGVTWSVTADHISVVFRQQIAARNTAIHPVGIAFSAEAPLFVGLYSKANRNVVSGKKHFFYSRDVASFITTVNLILEDLRTSTVANLDDYFSSIVIEQTGITGGFQLRAKTTGTPGAWEDMTHWIEIRSHVTGYITAGSAGPLLSTDATPWGAGDDAPVFTWLGVGRDFGANKYYTAWFVFDVDWATSEAESTVQSAFGLPGAGMVGRAAAGAAGTALGAYDFVFGVSTDPSAAEIEEWSSRRIWIDRDWSTLESRGIVIRRSDMEESKNPGRTTPAESVSLEVIDSGYDATQDAYWILVEDNRLSSQFHGWLHSYTVIHPVYAVAGRTDVVGFIESLITDVAANANDGNLPFIRDVDFDTTTEIEHPSTVVEISSQRNYAFVKPVAVEDVIAEELKLVGSMWSTDKNSAKLTFAPIPIVSGGIAGTLDDDILYLIDSRHIQTPAGGTGSIPSYEVQSQGLVSVVIVKDGYDAAEDEHKAPPHVISDANLLSTHKRKGLTDLTIAPKSTTEVEISIDEGRQIAARMMAVLGREYAVVKVQVPFSRFRIMLGSIVSLTSPHVPNALGTLGVTAKLCVVIGRDWNLDSSQARHGELELLMLLDEPAGYTPSGYITGQSGATTSWDLTISSANALNILVSPRGDGLVAATFAVDDRIRIVQLEPSPDITLGVVTAVSGDVVSVTLDSSWSPTAPGDDIWALEYATADDAITSQRAYAYVAGEDLLIDATDQARRFS